MPDTTAPSDTFADDPHWPGVPADGYDAFAAAGAAASTCIEWLETGANVRDTPDAVLQLASAAITAAGTLATNDVVFLDLAPGNGYAYDVAIAARTTTFGPELVVALPEFGRSGAFPPHGTHTPRYVTERLNLNMGDPTAYVIAVLLTLMNTRIDANTDHRLRAA